MARVATARHKRQPDKRVLVAAFRNEQQIIFMAECYGKRGFLREEYSYELFLNWIVLQVVFYLMDTPLRQDRIQHAK